MLAFLLPLVVSCHATYYCRDALPHQCQSTEYAWTRLGGSSTPPEVIFKSDYCAKHPEQAKRAVVRNGECFDGLFFRLEWTALVAYTPGQTVAQTALVHELMHAAQSQRDVYDPWHEETQDWLMVDVINQELKQIVSCAAPEE